MRRRRIVRTFRFDRILAFIIIVCFAVAGVCVLLSLSVGSAKIVVKKRTLYVVTYFSCATESEAKLKGEECFARGGAGNIVPDGSEFYVAAAVYSSLGEATAVAERLPDARIKEITFEKLGFVSSKATELAAEALSKCYFDFSDELSGCASELDGREVSEAVAIERCRLCASEASRLLRLVSAQMSVSTTSESDVEILSAVSELMTEAVVLFKGVEEGDGALSARTRRAQVALTLKTRDLSKNFK